MEVLTGRAPNNLQFMKLKNVIITGCLLVAGFVANAGETLSGKVLETTNVSSYTYVQFDTGKQKVWAAAPTFNVKVGDTVTISNSMAVAGYYSRTLDRNFDAVYFTDKVAVNGAKAEWIESAAAKAMAEAKKQMAASHPELVKTPDLTGIKKPDGGVTVEEIFAKKGELKGKNITVRGKVTKYNGKILGKNWIHVKDGTGAAGNNDLMVTSDAKAKVGDTVLVTGKVAVNRDFGSGYKWPVMIEDAKVTVE
jgi:ribosomal protein S17